MAVIRTKIGHQRSDGLGKSAGKLTTKEIITDALEELDFDVEKVDKLYETLEELNIEIIEDLEQDD